MIAFLLAAACMGQESQEAQERAQEPDPRRGPGRRGLGRSQALEAPAPQPGALSVPCPTCGRAAGQKCSQRTLGRYLFHQARNLAAGSNDRSR